MSELARIFWCVFVMFQGCEVVEESQEYEIVFTDDTKVRDFNCLPTTSKGVTYCQNGTYHFYKFVRKVKSDKEGA